MENVMEVRAGIFLLFMERNLQSGLFCKVVYGRRMRTVNSDKMVPGMGSSEGDKRHQCS